MKPGWAIIGKNKARRPFEFYEELKNGKVRLFLSNKNVIVDKNVVVIWPQSDEDAPQSTKS